jgi:hypothetical protein
MAYPLSRKSDVLRTDAAIGLAVLLREICEDIQIYSFSTKLTQMPPRRGFALRDAIAADMGGGTNMWAAIREAGTKRRNDIMIVITDEQTADKGRYSDANADLLVIINVASYQNGVGYEKGVLHISGWSDSVVNYIASYVKSGYTT